MTTVRRWAARGAAASFACAAIAFAADVVELRPSAPLTPPEHVRGPDQTFLTFPEWFLVHSPAEYASDLASAARPSAFPFYAHIGQFWQGYAAVNHEIAKYPFNGGYHAMVMVIGTSTTVEYALRGVYEHTIGRLAEATRTGPKTPEESFAARYAQEYVDFIRVDPWYRFDFWRRLKTLWSDVPLLGPDAIRRWERRFALTSELLVKEGYARLIKVGTTSLYDAPKPVTAVVLDRAPAADPAHAEFVLLQDAGPQGIVATMPRYEGFTTYARWLAAQGIDFRAIAGNDGDIVVSVLVPDAWNVDGVRVLFVQPIITRPGRQRVVFAVPVAQLADVLRRIDVAGVAIEHVYDF